jgi:hypothetical protein
MFHRPFNIVSLSSYMIDNDAKRFGLSDWELGVVDLGVGMTL